MPSPMCYVLLWVSDLLPGGGGSGLCWDLNLMI